jgi:hypothetical protein
MSVDSDYTEFDLGTWSDFDKAEWILKNGNPDIKWVYERALGITYRRVSVHVSSSVPPWINTHVRHAVQE